MLSRYRVLIFVLCMALTAIVPMRANEVKTLLVLNSYSENEPWVNDLVHPILLQLANDASVRCDIYDFNNALMRDSTDFLSVADDIMRVYSHNHPEYVVMVGSLAFNMRQTIKQQWGDVPMLLLSTTKDYIPLSEYFSTHSDVDLSTHKRLLSQQKEYNMTAIIIPQFYRQTVDMMVQMMPQMDDLVFLSDSIYINRRVAREIQEYMRHSYPDVRFFWLKASAANSDSLYSYLANKDPKRGLLLSTWLYDKHDLSGWKTPTTSDLKLIGASHNPIFTMNEAYIPLGAIGGVFPSPQIAREKVLEVLNAMLAGESIRDIPIYTVEDSYPCVNYRLLSKFDMPAALCPPGTVYYSKPPSYWEKYMWQTIVGVLIAALVLLILIAKNRMDNKTINALSRNAEFMDNMPIPYSTAKIRYDSDGDVTTIAYSVKNAAFEHILQKNVVPDSPFLLFPADFIAPKVTQLLKDGKPQVFVYHFTKTDTYYEFILCLINTKIYKKEHRTQSIDIFAKDITESYKMGSSLMAATRTLDLTIEAAKIIPWQYHIKRDTITYDYHKGDTILPHDTLEGEKSFEDFLKGIHPDDHKALQQMRDDVRLGRINEFNLRVRKNDPTYPGEVQWAELMGTVGSYDSDHAYPVVIGASRDITAEIRAKKEMAQALERANESDRMKSAFLASISHEIRTPLNAIVGFSNVIAHTESPEERLDFCEIINQNNEQLLALINDVLDLAKIESNAIDINYVDTDVNAMIEQVRRTMALKVPEGIRFNAITGSTHCMAELDNTRVTQILTNMIANSCKFTPSGSITFGYDITEDGMLYFYVRDTGIGLSEETRKKVFDRFFKHDTFVPGTGLGLSICKNLVEKMGGEIGVESAGEGKGSIFWFTVPYVPCADAFAMDEDGNNFFKRRMPHLRGTRGRDRLKVLIAEDNESNFRLLEHLLHNHFEVVQAANGNEAVRRFVTEEPDVVLMDISMPGMDGYAALREIRKFSATVPIIAVTAYVYASERSKLIDFGFDGYVSKPITQKAIVDAIGHALM